MFLIFIINFLLLLSFDISAKEVNLYTSRHYEADYELYRKFEIETGIKVNVVSGKPQPLEKRIIEEGKDCIGDLFFLADAGRLYSSENKKLFQKIDSPTLVKKVPNNLRNDYWFGITKRARIIYYNPDITSPDEVQFLNYENLSDSKWYKSIAITPSGAQRFSLFFKRCLSLLVKPSKPVKFSPVTIHVRPVTPEQQKCCT